MTATETIRVETRGRVGWITLDRPEALNALNAQLMHELVAAATAFDADPDIGAIVVTSSEKASKAEVPHQPFGSIVSQGSRWLRKTLP